MHPSYRIKKISSDQVSHNLMITQFVNIVRNFILLYHLINISLRLSKEQAFYQFKSEIVYITRTLTLNHLQCKFNHILRQNLNTQMHIQYFGGDQSYLFNRIFPASLIFNLARCFFLSNTKALSVFLFGIFCN